MGNKNTNQVIENFKRKLKTIGLENTDIKLKKQFSSSKKHFTFTLRNLEYCFTDTDLKIIDLKDPKKIESNKKIYRIWDPVGYKFYVSRDKKEIYTIDERGLILVNLKYYSISVIDDSFDPKKNSDFEYLSDVLSSYRLNFYLKIKEEQENVDIGELYQIKRYDYGKVRTKKVLQIPNLIDKNTRSLKLIFLKNSKIFVIMAKHKNFPSKCKFYFYCSKNFRLQKTWTTLNMNFTFIELKSSKDKILLRSETEIFLLNLKKMKSKFTTCLPSEHIFFTKKTDFKSSPSNRLRHKFGITFIKSQIENLRETTQEVIRLKNGDFIIKVEYLTLKFYYNLTKQYITLILRVDPHSELPFLLSENYLDTTPNINILKKFYLKKFNLRFRTIDFVYHKFFKKMSKGFYKRFDTVRFVEGTSKIYFEGNRLFDTRIYNRSEKFKETEEYKRLYDILYCIEYDWAQKKCVFYELPLKCNGSFWVLGKDWDETQDSAVFIIDEKKRVFLLDEEEQKIKEVDFSFLLKQTNDGINLENEKRISEGEKDLEEIRKIKDNDNFGAFIKEKDKDSNIEGGFGIAPGSSKHIKIFNKKIFFYNLEKSILLYDIRFGRRVEIISDLENTSHLIIHLNKKSRQIIIFTNTTKIQVYNIVTLQLWTFTLPNPCIKSLNKEYNILKNYVETANRNFCLITKDIVKEFNFLNENEFQINEILLNVDSDHFKSRTVKIENNIYNVISSECILDLTAGKYLKFNLENQFNFLTKVDQFDLNKLERLYKISMKFKQNGFTLFEKELQFGQVILDMGAYDMFEAYSKAICAVNGEFFGNKRTVVEKVRRSNKVNNNKKRKKRDEEDEEILREFVKGLPCFR